MSNAAVDDLIIPNPEQLDKDIKRIYASFSQEFKNATVSILSNKARARFKIIQTDPTTKDQPAIDQLHMAWAETSLEMMMILLDEIKTLNERSDAIRHLMPAVSTRKQ